ncbi:hypothetical protein QE152_g34133 [Popillia japonica]|uniref:Uncharacterized protein n=1 Tax=Popillia japonica TaxID=7064 RepID=A0AAW1IUM0_POPJA
MTQPNQHPYTRASITQAEITTIPIFNGDPNTLPIFIDACNDLIKTYGDRANPNNSLNTYLPVGTGRRAKFSSSSLCTGRNPTSESAQSKSIDHFEFNHLQSVHLPYIIIPAINAKFLVESLHRPSRTGTRSRNSRKPNNHPRLRSYHRSGEFQQLSNRAKS